VYGADVEGRFPGERWTSCEYRGSAVNRIEAQENGEGLSMRPGRIYNNMNSGAALVNLVAQWGVAKIVLLAYDMLRGEQGQSHHFGDHEGGLPNLGTLDQWAERMQPIARDLEARGVDIVNASRRTAITALPRRSLADALRPKPSMIISGMMGLGDNLHQRAVVRAALKKNEVWLETPWPSVYHDLPVNLLRKATGLRTQIKNAKREDFAYSTRTPVQATTHRISYTQPDVKRVGTFLGAMAKTSGVAVEPHDFRLPVPEEWDLRLQGLLDILRPLKPLLFYRPLVERVEWSGSAARNPDPPAYLALIRAIRKRFYVVSVADLEEGKEWIVGERFEADAVYHNGELPFELLAALAARSSLVFASPGFALILAQAVGARLVGVFGGHESARFYDHGDPLQHWVQPVEPCECFSKVHKCQKRIDVDREAERLVRFVESTDVRSAKQRNV
jgi:ADP-heptose:LPS heptosyltransferase